MDRAQGATQGFLPQNLHGTHTSSAEFSGRRAKRYVAAALGLAAWHLATSVEAAYRGLTMRFSDDICSPDAGVQYHSYKKISRTYQLSTIKSLCKLCVNFIRLHHATFRGHHATFRQHHATSALASHARIMLAPCHIMRTSRRSHRMLAPHARITCSHHARTVPHARTCVLLHVRASHLWCYCGASTRAARSWRGRPFGCQRSGWGGVSCLVPPARASA